MKHARLICRFVIGLTLCLTWIDIPEARQDNAIRVQDAAVCRDVFDHRCVDPGTQFLQDVGRVYCFTPIIGASTPVTVTHVWYHGEQEVFRISLPVKSSHWRTYSQKSIPPHQTGPWRVEVLGPHQAVLFTLFFRIVPDQVQTGPSNKVRAPATPETQLRDDGATRITGLQDEINTRTAARAPSRSRIQGLAGPIPPPPAKTRVGTKIRLDLGENGTEKLYVDLNHYLRPRVVVLGGAVPAVAVHIMEVSAWDGAPEIQVNGKAIRRVRSGLHRASKTLRILLDLDPRIPCEVKSYSESEQVYCVEVQYDPTQTP
ncbi:MAG: DUF2914 domain-containing protein [Deltaproteobacteria bacterium]|nr:DUF2914 domain-containing protein [Deltaproteobacteria bacterium]